MMVMPSNNTGFDCGFLFGKYEGQLAHLHSCERMIEPKEGIPWALDNGVFGAWKSGKEWDDEPFYTFLDNYAAWKPMWAVVPDAVGDRAKTLQMWRDHHQAVASFGCPLAFAVQDGMSGEDVPDNADIVFVGGTTAWKWKTLGYWTLCFPRVHVGRVNSYRLLNICKEERAESCDGTGWFRHPQRTAELKKFLHENQI